MNFLTAKILWIAAGVIVNILAVAVTTWTVLGFGMSGFATSQNTLALQMAGLKESLDSARSATDGDIALARGDLARDITNLTASIKGLDERLGSSLNENSAQIASLNSTISGVDKRLGDSISRQQAFETVVLQRIVFQGPDAGTGRAACLPIGAQARVLENRCDPNGRRPYVRNAVDQSKALITSPDEVNRTQSTRLGTDCCGSV